eukprot:TRINITY_DN33428_c0_g1_i1.p1 TRINITY_DN33428_c0_g1~~TRINITY_DN33428_c0_g1_i1.p1  ORF type:complete len:449 (-),score=82.24 TRINITY_DN33428_c0_g1_i1:183-1529(-)
MASPVRPTAEGLMLKMAEGVFKSSQTRHFVLQGQTLSWYKSPADVAGQPLGHISLSGSRVDLDRDTIIITHASGPKGKSSYSLKPSGVSLRPWLDALQNAAAGAVRVPAAAPSSPMPSAPGSPPAGMAHVSASPPGAGAVDTRSSRKAPSTATAPRKGAPGAHKWVPTTFDAASNCAVCHNMIWGTVMQGRQCKVCRHRVHHNCADSGASVECTATATHGGQLAAGDLDLVTGRDSGSEGEDDEVQTFMKPFLGIARLTKPAVRKIWNHYDRDRSGYLDRGELSQYIRDVAAAQGERPDPSAVDKVLHLMDQNGDNVVQWDEFVVFFQGTRDSAFLAQFRGRLVSVDDLRKIWNKYDIDGNGTLDATELGKLLRDLWSAAGASKMGDGSAFFDALPSFWDPSLRDFDASPLAWEEFQEVMEPLLANSIQRADARTRRKMAAGSASPKA